MDKNIGENKDPNIAWIDASVLNRILFGTISPYPTVVWVIMEKYKLLNVLNIKLSHENLPGINK